MSARSFIRVYSFLLGASWAFIGIGALFVLKSVLIFDVASALFFAFAYIYLSFFLLMLLDSFIVNKKRLEEAKKQTELLEKIEEKLTQISLD